MARARRSPKYEEVIKSIHFQYIHIIFVEYFRIILVAIKTRGYNDDDYFTFEKFCKYVNDIFHIKNKENNPLFTLEHYKYFNVLNKIDNFLKHNTVSSYNDLANNKHEKDAELKKFQASFVYTKQELKVSYESGYYAGNWLKITPNFIPDILENLILFSKEFCKLMYNEDSEEASWNSDEYLIDILRNEVIYREW